MPPEQFQRFVLAWSVVSALNEALNGYAAQLASLTPRTVSLGVLFMMAAIMHCLRGLDGGDPGQRRGPGSRICAALYLGLFVSTGIPSVAWRCFNPDDAMALEGLRHGAAISFELAVLTVVLVRVLSNSTYRGAVIAKFSRRVHRGARPARFLRLR